MRDTTTAQNLEVAGVVTATENRSRRSRSHTYLHHMTLEQGVSKLLVQLNGPAFRERLTRAHTPLLTEGHEAAHA